MQANESALKLLIAEYQEKFELFASSESEVVRKKLRSKSCVSAQQPKMTKRTPDKQVPNPAPPQQLPPRALVVSSEPSVSHIHVQQSSTNPGTTLTSSLPAIGISSSPTLNELAELIDKPSTFVSSSAPNTPMLHSPFPQHKPNNTSSGTVNNPPSRLAQFQYSNTNSTHQTILGAHKTLRMDSEPLVYCSNCHVDIEDVYYEFPDKIFNCSSCFFARHFTCGFCNNPVSTPFLFALNKAWHIDHFNCANCKQTITGCPFFDVKGMYLFLFGTVRSLIFLQGILFVRIVLGRTQNPFAVLPLWNPNI